MVSDVWWLFLSPFSQRQTGWLFSLLQQTEDKHNNTSICTVVIVAHRVTRWCLYLFSTMRHFHFSCLPKRPKVDEESNEAQQQDKLLLQIYGTQVETDDHQPWVRFCCFLVSSCWCFSLFCKTRISDNISDN